MRVTARLLAEFWAGWSVSVRWRFRYRCNRRGWPDRRRTRRRGCSRSHRRARRRSDWRGHSGNRGEALRRPRARRSVSALRPVTTPSGRREPKRFSRPRAARTSSRPQKRAPTIVRNPRRAGHSRPVLRTRPLLRRQPAEYAAMSRMSSSQAWRLVASLAVRPDRCDPSLNR